jgi:hypothetical protein
MLYSIAALSGFIACQLKAVSWSFLSRIIAQRRELVQLKEMLRNLIPDQRSKITKDKKGGVYILWLNLNASVQKRFIRN